MHHMQYHFTFFIKMYFKTDAVRKTGLYFIGQFMVVKIIQVAVGNNFIAGSKSIVFQRYLVVIDNKFFRVRHRFNFVNAAFGPFAIFVSAFFRKQLPRC